MMVSNCVELHKNLFLQQGVMADFHTWLLESILQILVWWKRVVIPTRARMAAALPQSSVAGPTATNMDMLEASMGRKLANFE